METVFTILLIIHIAAGFTSLITGMIALFTRKGMKAHTVNGRIFFYCMLIIAGSAVILSTFHSSTFLLLIAFFAFYQNLNGMRAIKNKTLHPQLYDWIITSIGFATGIFMIAQLNIVLMVFGIISVMLSLGDLRSHITLLRGKEIPRYSWLLRHIGMMIGSYIATFTAFVVVNIQFEAAPWLPWLAPSAVGIPVMIAFQRRFSNGLNLRKTNTEVPGSEKIA